MKNLIYSILICYICIPFFGCSGGSAGQEIITEEAYKMKSGKMVNQFDAAILNMETEDSTRTAQQDEILFIGSSSIRMWNSLLVDMLPFHAINRGFGGSIIPEVNYYTNRIVFPYKPPLIVFYCGENDITDGYSSQDVLVSFKTFDELVHQHLPETQILFISMKPSLDRWHLWGQFIEGNKLIQNYVESKAHLHYFDCSESMLTEAGTPDSTIFIEDGLHMNEAGYARWTAELKPRIQSIMSIQQGARSN